MNARLRLASACRPRWPRRGRVRTMTMALVQSTAPTELTPRASPLLRQVLHVLTAGRAVTVRAAGAAPYPTGCVMHAQDSGGVPPSALQAGPSSPRFEGDAASEPRRRETWALLRPLLAALARPARARDAHDIWSQTRQTREGADAILALVIRTQHLPLTTLYVSPSPVAEHLV